MSRHTRMARRLGAAVASVAALSIAVAGSASAAWSTAGTGAARGAAAGVTAPTTVTVPSTTVTNGTVAVSWSGATVPSGATARYYVERKLGTGSFVAAGGTCAGTFAAPIGVTSCNDTGVANGSYTYRVTTRLGTNWQAASATSATVTVTAAATLTLTNCVDDGQNDKSTCSGTYTGSVSSITISWVKSGSTTVTQPNQAVSGGAFSIKSPTALSTGTWTATATGGGATSNSVSVVIS